jgi:hypothetical protein
MLASCCPERTRCDSRCHRRGAWRATHKLDDKVLDVLRIHSLETGLADDVVIGVAHRYKSDDCPSERGKTNFLRAIEDRYCIRVM